MTDEKVTGKMAKPGAGTYILILEMAKARRTTVGRLGELSFASGYYAYVGSAMAGLAPRLARHLRQEKRYHWHIDYLTKIARIEEIWIHRGIERLECEWARLLSAGMSAPFPGFGASDCRCITHLFYMRKWPDFAAFAALQPARRLERLLPPDWLRGIAPPTNR